MNNIHLIIEGVDCIGKTYFGKTLKKFLPNYQFIDNGFLPFHRLPKKYKNKWEFVITGINIQIVEFLASLNNVIKTRFSISEYVYQQLMNRGGLDQIEMESFLYKNNKSLIQILLICDYSTYLFLCKKRNEIPLSENEFKKHIELFKNGLKRSISPFKFVINLTKEDFINKEIYENKIKKLISQIFISPNSIHFIENQILLCKDCVQYQFCSQVNEKFGLPVRPKYYSLDKIKYMFIGEIPSAKKVKNAHFPAFGGISGKILNEILEKLSIKENSYITNVVKCNTNKENNIHSFVINTCINKFLKQEIIVINPEKIIFLGNRVKKWLSNDPFFENYDILKVYHPSYLRYNKNKDLKEKCIKAIKTFIQ